MRLTYKTYAESAVKAEKKGHYLEAAKNWADAKRHTTVQKKILSIANTVLIFVKDITLD